MKSRVTLRVPFWMKRAAEELASREGMSMNQFLARILAEKVGSSGAAAFFAERGKGGDKDRAISFLESRPEVAEEGGWHPTMGGSGGLVPTVCLLPKLD